MFLPGARSLAALLLTSGTAHLVTPEPFERIVPPVLGDPAPWVRWSGVAELGCGIGLLVGPTRRAAGVATAALFVAVFPANVQMALDARGRPGWYRAIVLARLPLQVPLVIAALRVARRPDERRPPSRSRSPSRTIMEKMGSTGCPDPDTSMIVTAAGGPSSG